MEKAPKPGKSEQKNEKGRKSAKKQGRFALPILPSRGQTAPGGLKTPFQGDKTPDFGGCEGRRFPRVHKTVASRHI
jgi:hypothetical protein